ncbi:MAG: UDP-3-O-(3-hydroxymyristoyl)glucosamine N-acyltransferase [Rickettsiales bacterium]|nr:UDP-3-O-(3-hydroxymyristoyl)glucosamine N-acyltransferase [Rickettsiales bacterium]
MADLRFFDRKGPFTLEQVASISRVTLTDSTDPSTSFEDIAPLDRAEVTQISFFDNPKYVGQFEKSSAGACFVKEKFADRAPEGMVTLITPDPYRAYALLAQAFYPRAQLEPSISEHATISPSAKIGKGCAIEAHVFIGENVEIGENTIIRAGSFIDRGVMIGQDCQIGACSTVSHTILGNQVILHRGVNIGQDGFGFAMGREGHVKVPQLGRVVIEDYVEIGSGTCIDRGTGPDTTVGAGTKIDNLVQIGHNVQIGQGAIIVSQVGIAGSTHIGDGVVLGGQVGVSGHLRIGAGARIAAQSGVMDDIPSGQAYGGAPAIPVKDWHRQTIAIKKLIKSKTN